MRTDTVEASWSCAVCGKRVTPVLRFYRRSPDAFVCPHCGQPFHRFANEARLLDRLLAGSVGVASALMLIGLCLN